MAAFAFETATRHLFVLVDHAGWSICFTGPHRVASAETTGDADPRRWRGSLVEATADAAAPRLPRTTICDGDALGWAPVASTDGAAVVFGGHPQYSDGGSGWLCRWDRPTGKTTTVTNALPCLFALSPDGKRVVYYESDADTANDALVVADSADGRNHHVLQTGVNLERLPLPPTCHGNDRLTLPLADGEPTGTEDLQVYDVVDCHLAADGTLSDERVLSRDWPKADKPQNKRSRVN